MATEFYNSYLAASSANLTSAELRIAGDTIVLNRSADQWSLYGIDGHGMTGEVPDDDNHIFTCFPSELSSLSSFRLCHTNERVHVVSVNRQFKCQLNGVEAIANLFGKLSCEPARYLCVTFFVSESTVPLNNDIYGEFSIQLHATLDGNRPSCAVQVGQFAKAVSKERRIHFLKHAITVLGLTDFLQVVALAEGFRIDARPPWKVEVSGADLQRRNPWTFGFELSDSIDDAWLRVARLLRDSVVKHIENVSIGIAMAPKQYEASYQNLNEFASGWQVSFYGSYADGIDPYTADASLSPDGRFPIFTWMPERENRGIFFQVDVVPTPSGRRLEIHSNCESMQKLLDEAEAATGVRFTPFDPSAAKEH